MSAKEQIRLFKESCVVSQQGIETKKKNRETVRDSD